MTSYEFGDLVLVLYEYSDRTGAKKRPAVVVSSHNYHAQRGEVIVMPITSQVRANAYGDLFVDEWKEAGLMKPSVVKPVLTTYHRDLLERRLGHLRSLDKGHLGGHLSALFG